MAKVKKSVAVAKRQASRRAAATTEKSGTPPTSIPPPAFSASTSPNADLARKLFDGVYENPRDLQVDGLAKVITAHKAGARYVVLEAPTGTGKSGLAIALSKYLGQSFVGTLTAQLQEQYTKLFQPLGVEKLLGAGKFQCRKMPGQSCSEGRKEYTGKSACDAQAPGCPYSIQKRKALAAPICVGNFHSLLYNVAFAQGPEEGGEDHRIRPLMVLDEAHGAENMLMDQAGLLVRLNQVSFQTEQLPGKDALIEAYWQWLKVFIGQLKEAIPEMPDPRNREKAGELLAKCNFAYHARDEEQWIPERGERQDGSLDDTWFALKPLTVKKWGHWLWGRGNFTLLMTATVISPGALASSLGLDLSDGDYFELPCPFPPENRPIYAAQLDMTAKSRDTSWPVMVDAIQKLLAHHANDKGLILTPSNKMMEYIMKGIDDRTMRSRLIPASGDDRESRYNEHLNRKDATVLLASGYWEGADLGGDASRFQIIPQLPRPFWAGQIKARASIEPGWYDFKTWQKMIQGLGRSVRSETDSAVSYVLDGAFLRELAKPKSLIPTWMKPAVKELT